MRRPAKNKINDNKWSLKIMSCDFWSLSTPSLPFQTWSQNHAAFPHLT